MSINIQQLKKTTGFTLLEVMISMVIFSVGMLGLAGIQAIALKNNNTAYMRTIAMQQAYNMTDLLRSSTDFDGVVDSTFNTITSALGTAPTACFVDNNTTTCTTTQIAASDIYHWKNRMQSEMPSGRGKVTFDAATGVFTITIMWDEKRSGVTGESCSGGATDLKCYITHIQV